MTAAARITEGLTAMAQADGLDATHVGASVRVLHGLSLEELKEQFITLSDRTLSAIDALEAGDAARALAILTEEAP